MPATAKTFLVDCKPINGKWPSSPFAVVVLVGARSVRVVVTPIVNPIITIKPPSTTSVCVNATTANLGYDLSSSNGANLTVVVQSKTAGMACSVSGSSTGECLLLQQLMPVRVGTV